VIFIFSENDGAKLQLDMLFCFLLNGIIVKFINILITCFDQLVQVTSKKVQACSSRFSANIQFF